MWAQETKKGINSQLALKQNSKISCLG